MANSLSAMSRMCLYRIPVSSPSSILSCSAFFARSQSFFAASKELVAIRCWLLAIMRWSIACSITVRSPTLTDMRTFASASNMRLFADSYARSSRMYTML